MKNRYLSIVIEVSSIFISIGILLLNFTLFDQLNALENEKKSEPKIISIHTNNNNNKINKKGRIKKKKRKFSFKILPVIGFNSDDGFAYGAYTTFIAKWKGDPYLFRIDFAYNATTKWIITPWIKLDIPNIYRNKIRLITFTSVPNIQKGVPYYGIGNNTGYDSDSDNFSNIIETDFFNTDPFSSASTPNSNYIGGYDYYYLYKRIRPSGDVNLLFSIINKPIQEMKFYNLYHSKPANKRMNSRKFKFKLIFGVKFISQYSDRYHIKLFNSSSAVKDSASYLSAPHESCTSNHSIM